MSMLSDEIPSRTSVSFFSIKHKERAELEFKTKEFLSGGRVIDVIESGFHPPLVKINSSISSERWSDGVDISERDIYTYNNRSMNKKTTGYQDIYVHSLGGYFVQIGSNFAGRGSEISECIKIRDNHREKMGLKKAAY